MIPTKEDYVKKFTEMPLITFAIFAYNQEKYIQQAIDGAFSQTYSPLEIIISDDASTDSTAEIIREAAHRYQGPHKVIVNINKDNHGIGRHVNKIFAMASGDFLVLAAGDDISLPERTRITIDHWLKNNRTASSIYCDAHIINKHGDHTGSLLTALPTMHRDARSLISYSFYPKIMLLMGACSSYAKNIYSKFDPLLDDLSVEDIPLAVRSSLMGGIDYIETPLVKYRENVSVWLPRKLSNESFDRHFARMAHRARANHLVSTQILRDINSSGIDSLLMVAKNRYLATSFVLASLEKRKFRIFSYLAVAVKTKYWIETLFPAILFGIPRIHHLAFRLKNIINRN